jgi:2-methylisocitrate lyase-like PEP mutase family enzyme
MHLSNAKQLAKLATTLKKLHKPGNPLLLANVHDYLSATTIASLPSTKALATASYAVALINGVEDDDLTLEQNLAAAEAVGSVGLKKYLPVTVDFQDGYGGRIAEGVVGLLERGVVGVNLEDYSRQDDRLYTVTEQVGRIEKVISTAKGKGVDDFVVNARCDVLVRGGEMNEVIERGKAYLKAGATSVFVWGGGKRGVSSKEVKELVGAFEGRLNISLKIGAGLKISEVAELGVSRVSIGPVLAFKAMEEWKKVGGSIVDGQA